MELVQNVRHENVVELRAYFYSKDEKLMLYDHYNKGSVHALLHGRSFENRANLDWETRKRIALGAARGIAHIHTQSGAKLVHGNIKASNIFLDSQHYGCVSEYGLTNMISRYHAPESQ
ncbi:hypothetical protein RD792_005418 [Penstemon davidsonii]|uniref:Protein kinase domain-containing protein n=1 Tax=Penstemon davidsonii TaxID=160366 RepID=A0ABR0DKY8_9LAMI|nr:hypothetical protein RD792_005418 [Penstemon davidsonii]